MRSHRDEIPPTIERRCLNCQQEKPVCSQISSLGLDKLSGVYSFFLVARSYGSRVGGMSLKECREVRTFPSRTVANEAGRHEVPRHRAQCRAEALRTRTDQARPSDPGDPWTQTIPRRARQGIRCQGVRCQVLGFLPGRFCSPFRAAAKSSAIRRTSSAILTFLQHTQPNPRTSILATVPSQNLSGPCPRSSSPGEVRWRSSWSSL